MRILCDIPDEMIKALEQGCFGSKYSLYDFVCYVLNGTEVPKGHKIIDEWLLQEHLAQIPMEDRTFREVIEIIDNFPPIYKIKENKE